jgi:hypothetical protein
VARSLLAEHVTVHPGVTVIVTVFEHVTPYRVHVRVPVCTPAVVAVTGNVRLAVLPIHESTTEAEEDVVPGQVQVYVGFSVPHSKPLLVMLAEMFIVPPEV